MSKIKLLVGVFLLFLLLYTRFINLSWGLPYPFHPDERNMASALQQLQCGILNLRECFNPHFFAYGQFPLYLGYILIQLIHLVTGKLGSQISFEEAMMTLRFISATASILTVWFMLRIYQAIRKNTQNQKLLIPLLFIFSPALIQFAHFGTTESLLMLFYTGLIFVSICYAKERCSQTYFVLVSSFLVGLAVATKVSSLIFLGVPLVSLLFRISKQNVAKNVSVGIGIVVLALFWGIALSPHNLISFNEFMNSIRYESNVATGAIRVFYTRQFEGTIPIFFQFTKIFPSTLGIPILLLFLFGFFILPYKREYNLLRLSFLIYFLPTAFLYAKWTRFMAPIMPLMVVIAGVTLMRLYDWYLNTAKNKEIIIPHSLFIIILLVCCIPGLAFLSIYRSPDVRFVASDWIYQNIPTNSVILSETANVVDIPIRNPDHSLLSEINHYDMISFNFYDLDQNESLQQQLHLDIARADYIFIPSRRIFTNHISKKTYPVLNTYYQKLFSGELGFLKIKEFSSYPRIVFFGKTLVEFPDEQVEETWTVFDHPVIRIFQRTL